MKLDPNKKYFKIMNESEYHNGYQFHDGLNVDTHPWNVIPCCAGGIYFSEAAYIFLYLQYRNVNGYWIREVTIPEEETLISRENFKFKAHSIILGPRMALSEESTLQYLIDQGAAGRSIARSKIAMIGYLGLNSGIKMSILKWISINDNTFLLDYLIKQGMNIHECGEYLLKLACRCGSLNIIKRLLDLGSNIHISREAPLRNAVDHHQLEVVKYLVECGADYKVISFNNYLEFTPHPLKFHKDLAEYLYSLK